MAEFLETTMFTRDANNTDVVYANVFFYRSPTVAALPNAYSAALNNLLTTQNNATDDPDTDVVSSIAALLHSSATIERLVTRSLFNVRDFHEQPLNIAGANGGGSALPGHATITFRSARKRTGRNRAFKRFSPINEGDVLGDTVQDGTATALAATPLRFALQRQLVGLIAGENFTFEPVIVYRQSYVEDGVTKYRLPLTAFEAEENYDLADGWLWNANITTQRTRKAAPIYKL